MIDRAIRILTYILIALFPIGLLLRLKILPNVHLVPQDIIVTFIAILCFTKIYQIRKINSKLNNFYKLQMIFILFGLVSLFVNAFIYHDIAILASLLYAVRYLLYLQLLVALSAFSDLKNLRTALVYSGVVVVGIGFVQFVFFNDLKPLFSLGWDDHLYRLFSTFLDPNFSGLFFVLLLLFLIGNILKRTFVNSYHEIIFAFFTTIAIFLTYSRTALVALIAGLVIYGILLKKVRIILVVLVALSILLFVVSDISVEGLNPFRTASTWGRVVSMKEATQIIKNNWVIGVGFNSFRNAQIRYGFREPHGASISNADAGTDNSILFVLATTGILGASIFIASYLSLLRLFQIEGRQNHMLGIPYLGAFLVGSLFVNALFYTPILIWFFLTIPLLLKKKNT